MDDPTQNFAGGMSNVVDPLDTATEFKGDDNRLTLGGTGMGMEPAFKGTPSGMFPILTVTPIVDVTVPAGESVAQVQYTILDRQPGNNWKVVAHCQSSWLEDVQIDTSFTGRGTNSVLKSSGCPVSSTNQTELLSVWRTLWIERDTMETVPENLKYVEGEVRKAVSFPTSNPNVFYTTAPLGGGAIPGVDQDEYEDGKVWFTLLDGDGAVLWTIGPRDVLNNSGGSFITGDAVIFAPPLSATELAQVSAASVVRFKMKDDDDFSVLPHLPNGGALMDSAYADAYIRPANADHLNPNKFRPFRRHQSPVGIILAFGDLTSTPDFWATLVIGCFEHTRVYLTLDNDPDFWNSHANTVRYPGEDTDFGFTFRPHNASGIYLEPIRDYLISSGGGCSEDLITTHEIGHTPDILGFGHTTNHIDIMFDSCSGQTRFGPQPINHFRETYTW
jgi:hypothetical protein